MVHNRYSTASLSPAFKWAQYGRIPTSSLENNFEGRERKPFQNSNYNEEIWLGKNEMGQHCKLLNMNVSEWPADIWNPVNNYHHCL